MPAGIVREARGPAGEKVSGGSAVNGTLHSRQRVHSLLPGGGAPGGVGRGPGRREAPPRPPECSERNARVEHTGPGRQEEERAEGPGVALLSASGAVRWSTPLLLAHLGLARLPERVGPLVELLQGAGFARLHPSLQGPAPAGADVWERDGQALWAGEVALPDGGRQLWTLPCPHAPGAGTPRVRYLSLASHDLRGILANVRSYAGLLLSPRQTHEPKVRRGLETIARNADRALAFAQDFFDASRAELGGLAYEREPVPLRDVVAEAANRHAAEATAAGATVELDAPDDLPHAAVDAGRLSHALAALVHHQLARAQPGERVVLRARAEDGAVRVEVRRHGTPEPQDEVAQLFERELRALRERRVENAQRLWLARAEALFHGGDVTATTDDGGTTLTLRLPV